MRRSSAQPRRRSSVADASVAGRRSSVVTEPLRTSEFLRLEKECGADPTDLALSPQAASRSLKACYAYVQEFCKKPTGTHSHVKVAIRVRPLGADERALPTCVVVEGGETKLVGTDGQVSGLQRHRDGGRYPLPAAARCRPPCLHSRHALVLPRSLCRPRPRARAQEMTLPPTPTPTLSPQTKRVFAFDSCLDSSDPRSPGFATQARVFDELGRDFLAYAWKGYNVSLFAYGQTGSGKVQGALLVGARLGSGSEGLARRREEATLPRRGAHSLQTRLQHVTPHTAHSPCWCKLLRIGTLARALTPMCNCLGQTYSMPR
jgi:hypothetical protein